MTYTCLDLYCGIGGWTEGLLEEGFEVVGVELYKKAALKYPSQCIIADVRKLDGARFKNFDMIIGSPPCRDFSVIMSVGWKQWKNKPNVPNGLTMVDAFLRIVREAEPKYWLMENVPNLQRYLGIPPRMIVTIREPRIRRAFWGNFPICNVPAEPHIKNLEDISGPYRSWIRAKIPFCVSQTIAKRIRQELEK